MDLISTPLVKYHQVRVDDTDIYEDAWGFSSEFDDVLGLLGKIDNSPAAAMTERLIEMISSRG